jgi:hypothetical protein
VQVISVESLPYLADAAELRPLYAQPSALVRAKQIYHLDPHCWTVRYGGQDQFAQQRS